MGDGMSDVASVVVPGISARASRAASGIGAGASGVPCDSSPLEQAAMSTKETSTTFGVVFITR